MLQQMVDLMASDFSEELVHQLLDDVDVLSNTLAGGPHPSPQVTRTTIVPILRRWICDQQFHKIQKLLGQRHIVKFDFWENASAVSLCERGMLEIWLEMIVIGGFAISPGRAVEGKTDLVVQQRQPEKLVGMPSHKFFNQKIAYWENRFYRRCDLLKLYANKRGGVHLDQSRGDGQDVIDELGIFLGFEIDGSNYKMLTNTALADARSDRQRRARSYDIVELVAIDTATTFARSVHRSAGYITDLIR
jgi:hypothetical protein